MKSLLLAVSILLTSSCTITIQKPATLDYVYITSNDQGSAWLEATNIAKCRGYDGAQLIGLQTSGIYVTHWVFKIY